MTKRRRASGWRPTAGGDAIPLTLEEVSSEHPRWSPDGKYLAFLSKRDEGKTQVWLLNRQGGEAQRLTETMQDVKDFAWSPDSKRLVLMLQDPTPEDLDAAKEKATEKSEGKEIKDKKPKAQRPWVVDRYQFKEDEIGYLERFRTHLYVFDIAGKTLIQVTSGDFDDEHPAWSPDGKFLAFQQQTHRLRTRTTTMTQTSGWWPPTTPTRARTRRRSQPIPVVTDSPAWSPDGKWIAYEAQPDPKLFIYGTSHIGGLSRWRRRSQNPHPEPGSHVHRAAFFA